jgi:hypothetical protein
MLARAYAQALNPTREMTMFEAAVLGLTVTVGGMAAIAVLYVVKSALGINLMPGPSPLHDLLYPLVRGY